MKVIPTAIPDVIIIEPTVYADQRGYFFESFSQREFDEKVAPVRFVQDNESCSSYGVLRGLHYQVGEYAQAKLVRVIEGVVMDVAVDIRRGSPTFGKWVAVELTGENHRQLFIPRGFAHGFVVKSPRVVFAYKTDNFYAPGYEAGIAWNDPQVGIDWKIPEDEMILSPKDMSLPRLCEIDALF
ncbi:MAG: dTDP-4-dehydrorhamnose 3,5-epimerase [Flavobacteriales bacterium]|nr:dTDP-4-dehydrorhamnose 3,5-epimerase [Flavobacteriales bacterium]